MIFKDMVWAGVEAAVGKDGCSDVVVVDGGEGREWVIIGEGGIQDGRAWHVEVEVEVEVGVGVGEPVGYEGETSCEYYADGEKET